MDSLLWVFVVLLLAGASVYALLAHSHHYVVKQIDEFPQVQSKSKSSKKASSKISHKARLIEPSKVAKKKKSEKKSEKKSQNQKKAEPKKKDTEQKKGTEQKGTEQKQGTAPQVKKRSIPGAKGIVRAGGDAKAFHVHNIEFDLPYHSEEPGRKALQFGLLYRETEYALEGCINDINNVKDDLLVHIGFKDEHIIQITDDTKIKPTKKNMMRALSQLATHTVDGDIIFLQYSGHGTEVKDKSGDEADGFDEALCPLDGGVLIDDWIFDNFIKQLESKPKTRVFALFDCCHSGTCMDLAFQYAAHREPKPFVKQIGEGKKSKNRKAKAHVIGFSAALDNQQAVDMQDGIPQGAFTNSFLQVLKAHIKHRKTYREFLIDVDQLLAKQGFVHQASISSSQPINLDHEFHLY